MLKRLALLAIAGVAAIACLSSAQADNSYQTLSDPVEHDTNGKILVQEVFWYGCPHCYSLESDFKTWRDQAPSDVDVELLPATMGKTWTDHARAFYAAKDLGILDKTHEDFFKAIHEQGQQLTDADDIADFYSNYGVSKKKVLDTLNSFGLKSQVNQAHAELLAYKIMGTPAIVVDGKYVVTPGSAGGVDNMLNVTDELIDKVRDEQASQ